MKKGEMSTHALLSLVLMVAILALAIYLIYSLSGNETDYFKRYIDIPVG